MASRDGGPPMASLASWRGVGGATREIRGGHGATTFPFFIDVGDGVFFRLQRIRH